MPWLPWMSRAESPNCATSPETEDLPGLNPLHANAFVPMSYHLVTGRGCARLMLSGQCRYTLLLLTTNCLFSTLDAAENIRPNLELMRSAAPARFRPLLT